MAGAPVDPGAQAREQSGENAQEPGDIRADASGRSRSVRHGHGDEEHSHHAPAVTVEPLRRLEKPRFRQERRLEAIILPCCSSREFLGPGSPPALTRRIRETNARTSSALKSFARGRGFDLDACRLALIAFPLAAVRQYLPSHIVPASVDDVVARAADAVIHSARDAKS